jgi:galactonate dehydratase
VKIARIQAHHLGPWLYVSVETDNGIVGVGEAGLWSFPRAAAAVIEDLADLLAGQDATTPERIFQRVDRHAHFRGSAVSAALSGIDIALWDAIGKHFEQPIYRLWGGPVRERIRLYAHIAGTTNDELVDSAEQAVREGFTAIRFDPFRNIWPADGVASIAEHVRTEVGAVRKAVGNDVDICLECHFKLTPGGVPSVLRAIADYRIMFIEDPFPPESFSLLSRSFPTSETPLATGERLTSLGEFSDLLDACAVSYIRPDVCVAGGLTQARKIAALAEARGVGVVPHNWLSPVNTAASVHLDASISNFVIQEYTADDAYPKNLVVPSPIVREGGYLLLPPSPGLGIEVDLRCGLDPVAARLATPAMYDGSFANY